MKQALRNGVRLPLLFILLFALISIKSPAGVSRASEASSENSGAAANSSGAILESVQFSELLQSDDPPGVDPALIKKLKKNARGNVSISTKKSTDFASFVRVSKDGDLLPSNRSNTPNGKANGFFAEYGGLFGVKNANAELALLSTLAGDRSLSRIPYLPAPSGETIACVQVPHR